jgi:hypothetical protein
MAKSETLSETRQKFEEWAREHFSPDFWPVLWSADNDGYIDQDGHACNIVQSAWEACQAGRLQGLEEAAKKLDFDGHICNTPNSTDGPCYACAKEKVMEWVFERYENCVRIAKNKTGEDRAGWLKDADCFMLILQLFKAAAIREKANE